MEYNIKVISLFLVLTIKSTCFAQIVSPEVIGSSGDHFSNSSSMVSWTIGEPVIETFNSGSNLLSQGFHQTNLIVEDIQDNDQSIDFSVFPNPATEQLNILLNNTNGNYKVNIYDVEGKLINTYEIQGYIKKTIDVSHYSTGIYLLHLVDQSHKSIKVYKIQKLH